MKHLFLKAGLLMAGLFVLAMANARPATAKPATQDDQIEHGKYLMTIAGCGGCHTPLDPNTFQPILDLEYAGGYPFPLGPAGTVFSTNLTPDKETGLGDWTDEEVKRAITEGIRKDGSKLFPVMPYTYYSTLSDADVDAIIAYLRSVKAIKNEVPPRQLNVKPEDVAPPVTRNPVSEAPAPSDTANRGRYLLRSLIACSDCHTPLDPQTGAPMLDTMYFGGGQPYEGPWGIVYAANISPDKETGIGDWTDTDIKRVLQTGVRPDGRRVVLMPWQDFAGMSDEDLNALIYYLRNDVKPVSNEVPDPALQPEFVQMVELEPEPPPGPDPLVVGGIAIVALLLVGGALFLMRRRSPAST
jgi:mono/diheme cytochrome c family protein